MSPSRSASATARSSPGSGRAALTALIVVGVAIGMLLLVRSRPGVQAFDPRSDAADGASAAVELLRQFGADVQITSRAPAAGSDGRVFVIADRLNGAQHRDLLEFVRAGGVAVVADPYSELHGGGGVDDGATRITDAPPGSFTGGRLDASQEANVVSGRCTIAALDELRGVFTPDGLLFPVRVEQDRCFGDDEHAFVIVQRDGRGAVVGFGDNRIVTNQYLRYADNAGLITSLLAPDGGGNVTVMLGTEATPSPSDIGQGDETLADLVSPGVWMGLTQLALAFVVLGIARGVRPGRAVREPTPTPIAGNELVLATGNLMQRAHHFDRAGHLIRDDFYRELCVHYSVPLGTAVDRMSEIVGHRSAQPLAAARLPEVLYRQAVDAAALVRLRDDIDLLRRQLMPDDAGTTRAAIDERAPSSSASSVSDRPSGGPVPV